MFVHGHLIELAFFVAAVLVVFFSFRSYQRAQGDIIFMLANQANGPRKIIADANAKVEGSKLRIGFVMLLASGSALFLEPPPPTYRNLPQSIVFIIAWIVVGIDMVITSITAEHARKKAARHAPITVDQTVARLPPPGDHTEDETARAIDAARAGATDADRIDVPPVRNPE